MYLDSICQAEPLVMAYRSLLCSSFPCAFECVMGIGDLPILPLDGTIEAVNGSRIDLVPPKASGSEVTILESG
jgi:hypothetical protein